MSPLRQRVSTGQRNQAGLKTGLKTSLGPFYGMAQEQDWVHSLQVRDRERGRTPQARAQRIQELSREDVNNITRHQNNHAMRLAQEREKHAKGFGQLGPAEDRIQVHTSALAGDVTAQTPRFLETYPRTPKERNTAARAATANPLTLGSEGMDYPKRVQRSINYDPINHAYKGDPRDHTALQRRAMKERTGYVTVAGGRKDLSVEAKEFPALNSTMQRYVEYDFAKVNPVQKWLKDEQTDASGGLRCFPAQKGISPLTRRLVQCHKAKVGDWHVSNTERDKKRDALREERIAVNAEKKRNFEMKMGLQEANFKIKDPFTDHVWGINHGKEPKPFRGFNTTTQQHYHPEDEASFIAERDALAQEHIAKSYQRTEEKMKPTYDIVHHANRKTGVIEQSDVSSLRTAKRVDTSKASHAQDASAKLYSLMAHSHDQQNGDLRNVSFAASRSSDAYGQSYDAHNREGFGGYHRHGAHSGVALGQNVRFQASQDHARVESHANDESQQRKDPAVRHDHAVHDQETEMRYAAGARSHIRGGEHIHQETIHNLHPVATVTNQSGKLIRYEAVDPGTLPTSQRTAETAEKSLWNAGSSEKYQRMEQRKTGVSILKKKRELTGPIGRSQHTTLQQQRHAQHLDALAQPVSHAHANKSDVIRAADYAHHSHANPADETRASQMREDRVAAHHMDEDMQRFDHKVHHHTTYGHTGAETDERNQFGSANNAGELNRFFAQHANQMHKSVMEESDNSREVWESMKDPNLTMEKRSSVPIRKQQAIPVKAVTSANRVPLSKPQKSDWWKTDGKQNTTYVPKPPPRRTNATRGVARFI